MSRTPRFDEAYFSESLGEPKTQNEPITDYSPLRLDLPKSTDFDIMLQGPKGGFKYNPSGTIAYMRSQLIVYDNGIARMFDGRVYSLVSLQTVKNLIYDAVARTGIMYVPTEHEIRTTILAAKSNLRIGGALCISLQFPDPQMGEDYETDGKGVLIAFENGILNTATDKFLPFSPFVYLTSYVHARYDPTKVSAQAKSVLQGIIPNSETLDFLFEMIGYILYDRTMYPPALFNFYGPGNTGKSALEYMIKSIMGMENVSQLGIEQITAKFMTAELEGKLLNICGETGDASSKVTRVDGQLIKQLSNGDKITVEKKNQDPYDIYNTAKLLFVTNSIPDFGDNTSGLYRRLYVIPCRIQQDKSASIYDKLVDDESRAYVVNMAYKGYKNMLARGNQFSISPQMNQELEQFKTQDSLMDFILATFGTSEPPTIARRITESDEYCWTTTFYELYCGYTRSALSQPLSRKKFVERIRNEYALKTKTVAVNVNGLNTTRTKYIL